MAESPLVVHIPCELTGRNECVDPAETLFKKRSVSPPLRRSAKMQGAAKALGFVVKAPVVLPEHMHGTDQPVLMSSVELEKAAIVRLQPQHLGPKQ